MTNGMKDLYIYVFKENCKIYKPFYWGDYLVINCKSSFSDPVFDCWIKTCK